MSAKSPVTTDSIWYVYMVRCRDNTLYTGITTDLARRIEAHNRGKNGAKYTRSRRPVRLVYQEGGMPRPEAARREYRLRKLPAAAKEKLIGKDFTF